jgi:2,5-dihydroxypyridine 5,6-dioxygenase
MHNERIEAKWIDCFVKVFEMCRVAAGDAVAILSETQSRRIHPQLSELALLRLGARPFHVVTPTPPLETHVPVRSTGASNAIQHHRAVLKALTSAPIVVDCTVEGLIHAEERGEILASGTRIMMISNDHPEALERLMPDPGLKDKVLRGVAMAKAAQEMHVTSVAGTDLRIDMQGANIGGGYGLADEPGRMDYWPGGVCAFYPRPGGVNGTVVLAPGDINLTFKRYIENPIRLTIENDFIVDIDGPGMDAPLMRSYFESWNDPNAYATAHLGWGMNPAARWDALIFYDKDDTHGTEQRAFAGNFLFSTGSNRFANRHTLGHFDLPMRACTVRLDGKNVVEGGRLIPELA